MATRRDMMDSYAFARRRLLAAFLRPTPTRSEENAPRPLRSFTASAVIGVIALVGLGIYGAFDKGTPHDWNSALIVDSATGSRYVERQQTLYPVLNLASARLLEDPSSFKVVNVPDSVVAGQQKGQPIGIVGAPDALPNPGDVQQSAWQICSVPEPVGGAAGAPVDPTQTAPQTQVFIDDPLVGTVAVNHGLYTDAAIVTDVDSHAYYLIQDGKRYRLQDATVANALDQNVASSVEAVKGSWLDQVPDGGTVWLPHIPNAGAAIPATVSHPDVVHRVGDSGYSTDSNGARHYYVMMPSGLMEVSPFVYTLVRDDPHNGALHMQTELPIAPNQTAITASPPDQAALLAGPGGGNASAWPMFAPGIVNARNNPIGESNQVLCMVPGAYDPATKQMTFALRYGGVAPASGIMDGARPAAVGPASADMVHVQQGKGALVQAVGSQGAGAGQVWLITDTGVRYLVVPNDDPTTQQNNSGGGGSAADAGTGQDAQALLLDTLARLGYKDVTPVPMRFTIVNLLQAGPALSVHAAEERHAPSSTVVTQTTLPPATTGTSG